ncbi:MAG: RtcB family protein [Syntrophorhabdaceae bacterium]
MYKFKEDKMNVPCYVWSRQGSIEQGAIDQIKNASSLPFAFHHTSLMADAHQGYGVSIGSVVALKDVVCPSMVGVDIGCGMCAVKTSLTEIDKETLKKIMGEIRKAIPVGFNKHKEAQKGILTPKLFFEQSQPDTIFLKEYDNAELSLGTLGGGNHFIEIQKGSDGYIWIMIHSGSRNLGKQVADYYNKVAIELNKKWFSNTQKELNFLPVDSEEGQAYIREMSYCVEFALANRKLMMDKIKDIFQKTDMTRIGIPRLSIVFEPMINIAHNYARLENHFGENVWVHRKGATLATKNTIGIIPGSQGTKSYIVKGKGNPESFMSCSHGAGRKMGRNEAIKNLNLEEEIKRLDDMGVVHAIRGVKDLDEAPGSYKDIDIVMENQKDLVEILVELTPLAVIKG